MSKPEPDARRRPRRQLKTWQRILFRWRLPFVMVLVLMLLSAVVMLVVSSKISARAKAKELQKQQQIAAMTTFEGAVVDALQAEQDEIHKLVCLTKEDGNVTYDEENDRVQLVVWSEKPQNTFKKDEQMTLENYTYAYPDLELVNWGKANADDLKKNKEARLCKLFGMPERGAKSTFLLVTVAVERVLRPAYQPDAQLGNMNLSFEQTVGQDFITWFNGEMTNNYFVSPRPWTRLGYTYDWGVEANQKHYGVTEFVIPANTKVTIKSIYSNEDMVKALRRGRL